MVKLDAASEESWIDAFGAVRQAYGGLNILVNGAGTQIPRSFPSETTLTDWRQLMSVNLDGVFLGTKHGLVLMTESQPVSGRDRPRPVRHPTGLALRSANCSVSGEYHRHRENPPARPMAQSLPSSCRG